MKLLKTSFLLSFIILFISSCANDLDDLPASDSSINDFIYRGLRENYLYVNDVPNLFIDQRSSSGYQSYLSASTPENFFESLIFDRQNTDRFSWLTSDYIALEQQFQGQSTTNGMLFGLVRIAPGSNTLFGYVKYVLPGSNANSLGITRGMLFTSINNTTLTIENYRSLLQNDIYTIELANGDSTTNEVTPNGTSITLSKQVFTENPVFITNSFTVDTETVGYLMYNKFTADFNSQLNAAFGILKANAVDQLVLDLRYNPGGSVNSAALLASMVTGQFNGQIVAKLKYNSNLSGNNINYNFTNTTNGETINSLNLNKIYILTTSNTASASEMIINSLKPYIEVVLIGTNSTGKSQASVTLYDSPDFSRNKVNPIHLYAMQPLVALTANKNDVVVPNNGLTPQTILEEDLFNLGTLGDVNEPLLAEALSQIDLLNKQAISQPKKPVMNAIHSTELEPFSNDMRID